MSGSFKMNCFQVIFSFFLLSWQTQTLKMFRVGVSQFSQASITMQRTVFIFSPSFLSDSTGQTFMNSCGCRPHIPRAEAGFASLTRGFSPVNTRAHGKSWLCRSVVDSSPGHTESSASLPMCSSHSRDQTGGAVKLWYVRVYGYNILKYLNS